ncbi:MAG TPA: RHS repeat-associated core domain-containing protein [Verrucomicrobiota bacterium]|nr:RHS repeat-associated core domain-containing protein [Verrucomicrobiota bacterium]
MQTFSVDALNQLTSVGRANTLTVAGGTSGSATNVTVNGYTAALYGDGSFAKEGFTLSAGPDTFTAVARDSLGRVETNVVSVTLPASVAYAYDGNGNLVSDGRRGFEWDAENQLVRVTVTNSWRSQFLYDGLGRRRVRTECVWQNSTWVTNAVVRYVYDGMLVVQERAGNNLPQVTYTRGRDLSGSREGAGGIGGLLARTENAVFLSPGGRSPHAYYRADGNGNITCLVDVAGAVAARYLYDPYGNLIAKAGRLADANLYRFSSKELHVASGLYYYGYRFYEPSLQRWISRDPLAELGGVNLHAGFNNNPLNVVDPLGLEIVYDESEAGHAARMAICYLKSTLPADARLRRLIEDLEKSQRKVTILPMGKGDAIPGHERTMFGNSRIYIDFRPGGYRRGSRHWTYRQALADELLHAWWWIMYEKTWDHGDDHYDDIEKEIRPQALPQTR